MAALEEIRSAELDIATRFLPPGGRILELGGGSGYQAYLLSRRGFEVVSLDIPSRPPAARQYHPVETYDGVHIPYPDASFDAVFSSNVLEHVGPLPDLLRESSRVLRPGGISVHLMPTPTWRLWTSVTHYVVLPRRLARFLRRRLTASQETNSDRTVPRGQVARKPATTHIRARGLLLPGPHGRTDSSAVAELIQFRAGNWERALNQAGLEVTDSMPNRLFYTGHRVLARLPVSSRRRLSRLFGSSCRIYVTKPAAQPAPPLAGSVADARPLE